MPARIILVRHGPSAHVATRGSLDRAGVERSRNEYNAHGIQVDAQPPDALRSLAASATHIIASDMRRAIESAERLTSAQIQVSALLRESPLAIPHWPTRLPLMAWGLVIHAAWSVRILRRTDADAEELARADAAAAWLIGMVADSSQVLVVTHGVFRRLVANQLIARGWRSQGRQKGYQHWSSWEFTPR